MKQRRFLAYMLAGFASVAVIMGCSNEEDQPFEPTQNSSQSETRDDAEYKYPTDTIIYVDERTELEKEYTGGGLMIFKEESFKDYGVVVTRKVNDGSYEIYIPAEGAKLDLETEYSYGWLKSIEYIYINEVKEELPHEILSDYKEDDWGNKRGYFYRQANDNITIVYDTQDVLRYTIPENTTGKELRIETCVYNDPHCTAGAIIIFIQAAK